MKIGQVGNLILWSTVPVQCPICDTVIPPQTTHRHDGPLSVDAEWVGGEIDNFRVAELWIEP